MEDITWKELAERVGKLSPDDYNMFQKELSRIEGKELITVEIKMDKKNNFDKN